MQGPPQQHVRRFRETAWKYVTFCGRYVLVDRQSFKSKKDCRLRDEKTGAGAEQT